MMLLKCCTQYTSKFGKLSSSHRTENISFHSNPKEEQCQRMLKLPFGILARLCSKFFNVGFSSMLTRNFQMDPYPVWFGRGRGTEGTREKISNIFWVMEKAKEFRKTYISASLTLLKLLIV